MDLLDDNDLQTLIEEHDGFHLSIFLPTFRAGKKTKQNAIRFKNLLAEAKDRLVSEGLHPPQAEAFLEPAYRYLRDVFVWRHQSDGLAVFITDRDFFHYRLPLSFQELMVLGDRFHIKPLLPLFNNNGTFYILALNLHYVRLFQCSRFQIHPVHLLEVPKSIDEALQYDNIEKQIQFHTGRPGPRGKQVPVYHGQGVGIDDIKDYIVRYFRQIDKGLHDILNEEHAPLLLGRYIFMRITFKGFFNSWPMLPASFPRSTNFSFRVAFSLAAINARVFFSTSLSQCSFNRLSSSFSFFRLMISRSVVAMATDSSTSTLFCRLWSFLICQLIFWVNLSC